MRNDVILLAVTEKNLRASCWDDVEATFTQHDGVPFGTIFKTKRDIEGIQNFNLKPGSLIVNGDEYFKILTINYLPSRPKYALCRIEQVSDPKTALDELRTDILAKRRKVDQTVKSA